MDDYADIRVAIQQKRLADARRLLAPILKTKPTAEAWYLAAQVVEKPAQAAEFCRRALAIDALHTGANRLLYKIEGAKPITEQQPKPSPEPATPPVKFPTERKIRPSIVERSAQKNKQWRRMGCIGMIVLNLSCALFTMNAVGVVPGVSSGIRAMMGGATPIAHYNETPLADLGNAPVILPASKSERASTQNLDILEDGYLHEYTFNATAGQFYAVYIQFLSIAANDVKRNVAIVDPNNKNIIPDCQSMPTPQSPTMYLLACPIQTNGAHAFRVLGRAGESTGAYVLGVRKVDED